MRNVPVLLHVVFWYGLILHLPPASDAAPRRPACCASNRGIYLAWFAATALVVVARAGGRVPGWPGDCWAAVEPTPWPRRAGSAGGGW